MTRKVYRSAMGKTVDIGAMQIRNEDTRAVGNMNVNARGDIINQWNQPIDSRNKQVSKQYNRQVASNVENTPVNYGKKKVDVPATPEDFEDNFTKEDVEPVTTKASNVPEGGLASALAKARQIKQEPILPQKQATKNQPGVTKV